MTSKKETFTSLVESFRFRHDVSRVFDDFLTMSLCAVTRDPKTGLSHYEDLYMDTIRHYAKEELRFQFPKMLDALIDEMGDGLNGGSCTDVLGSYYEQQCAKSKLSQFFTPWPICEFMAKSTIEETKREDGRPLRILEPACGSGRLLLASAKQAGLGNEFYGIDVDRTCVKMTALNLFLHGVFHSEVMCANALLPDDFQVSYVISLVPIGIFRIDKKEESRLWHLVRHALEANRRQEAEKPKPSADIKLPSEGNGNDFGKQVSQITLF